MTFEERATRLTVELARRHEVTLRWGERPRAYRRLRCVVSPRPTTPAQLAEVLHELGHCALSIEDNRRERSDRFGAWREGAASQWARNRYQASGLPGLNEAEEVWRRNLATYLNGERASEEWVASHIPQWLRPARVAA